MDSRLPNQEARAHLLEQLPPPSGARVARTPTRSGSQSSAFPLVPLSRTRRQPPGCAPRAAYAPPPGAATATGNGACHDDGPLVPRTSGPWCFRQRIRRQRQGGARRRPQGQSCERDLGIADIARRAGVSGAPSTGGASRPTPCPCAGFAAPAYAGPSVCSRPPTAGRVHRLRRGLRLHSHPSATASRPSSAPAPSPTAPPSTAPTHPDAPRSSEYPVGLSRARHDTDGHRRIRNGIVRASGSGWRGRWWSSERTAYTSGERFRVGRGGCRGRGGRRRGCRRA
jgi:hypothetical protein